ncbi:MAG: cytochrome c [Limnohabitans sp.]|nr:cytochrome c [Limnohabitans sp.]
MSIRRVRIEFGSAVRDSQCAGSVVAIAAAEVFAMVVAVVVAMVVAAGVHAAHTDDKSAPPRQPSTTALPTASETVPVDFPGLHQVVSYAGKSGAPFYSGSAPDGTTGLDSLAALGIKTIISVDGAIPDVAAAKARGLRYVHLPIGYDGFDDARKAELVRAVRDLPKPLYIHCHHGKHRSAGAAGTIAVSLGWMTNEEAAARMKVSETAASYTGLWSCEAKAAPMMSAAIDAASADFPEITKPDSMVAAMIAIDEAFDRIKLVEKNGWKVPASHPDLAPAADAGKMVDFFRLLENDAHLAKLDEKGKHDFLALLHDGAKQTGVLEEALVQSKVGTLTAALTAALTDEERARIKAAMGAITANCKACHAKYRD